MQGRLKRIAIMMVFENLCYVLLITFDVTQMHAWETDLFETNLFDTWL